MEVYLLGSLLGLGYYLNSTDEPKKRVKNYPKKIYRGNVYDYEQYDRAENQVFDLADEKFRKSQNLYENNVVGHYTPDILYNKKSERSFSEKSLKEDFGDFGNTVRSDFSYIDEDCNEQPSTGTNRQLDYSTIIKSNGAEKNKKDIQNSRREYGQNRNESIEHFSDPSPLKTDNAFSTAIDSKIKSANDDPDNYNLDQQFDSVSKAGLQGDKQVYEKKPFHNNMVPFFGGTIKQNVDPLGNETKLNMYTGQWDYSRKQKQEIAPMFAPEKNVRNIYGDSALLKKMDENMSRYIPSLLRTNEAPTEKVYVTPGLNLGYNEVASFGFQDPVRALPKTTNEIRAKNKPKLTYDRPVISGKGITQEGTTRPNQNKNLPELVVYNEKGERNFGAKAVVVGETARPTFLLGRALRSFSRFFMGAAKETGANKAQSNAGYTNNAKRSSHKTNYIAPAAPATNKKQQAVSEAPAKKTKRQAIEKNEHSGYFNSIFKAVSNYIAPAKETIKQTTLSSSKPMNMKPVEMKTQAYFQDKAKATIKETTESNKHTGNLTSSKKGGKLYNPDDKAKTTIRQTTEFNNHEGNIGSTRKLGKVYNPDDKAKTTVRETTELNNHEGNIGSTRKVGKVYNPDDKAKTTVRETTELNNHEGNIASTRKVGKVYNPDDKAKITVRETTELNNHEGNIGSTRKVGKAYNPDDKAKTTIKETTELNNHEGNIGSTRKVGKAYNPDDKAKTTIKETTELNNHEGNIGSTRKVGKVYNPDDKAKTTIKETTELNNHEGNIGSTRKVGKAYNPDDKAKTTVRETTELNNHEGNIGSTRKVGKAYNPDDKAKTTVRETTELNNHEGNIGSTRKVGKAYDPDDKAKTTVRETTELNNHEGNVGITVKAAKVYDPEDKPEATLKDVVKVQNYKGISTVATKKIKVWDPEDKAKYTTKQDALVKDYVGGKNSNQLGGAYQVTEVDPKYTSRQDALIEDYVGTAGHTVVAHQEYDAAYAAETNALKEKIAKGRAPTQNSVKLAAGGDMQNVVVKRLDNDRRNPRDFQQDMPNCDVPYQLPPTANPYSITKEKNTVFNNYTDRIQPDILDAYRSNPYTQSLSSYVFP